MIRLPGVLIVAALLPFLASPGYAQRLPTTVIPSHYTLWFAPDLERQIFRGRETIQVELREPTTSITLNAAEITFGTVSITAGGRTQTARVSVDATRETATLSVPRSLSSGNAAIDITYTGILNDKLRGFYISNANGRSYAVSQMEATDARRAFPSFDEPAYKATFDIALMVDRGDTAISNGRQISDTQGPEAGKHTVRFSTTPKMSTYLVALVVGDFVCREGASDAVPIRVCSTPDKRHLTGFALEAAQQQLAFFNRYFGIKYPFGKLDIVGVPDFAAGAMENTGAIVFREQYLLADPEHASVTTLKNVAEVTSHEIAHQWLGDLVTMKWWDDIWLNEGFATWMEAKPLQAWKPEWHVELDETTATQQALSLDALRSTRPIRTRVETPAEINGLFDAIAYQKTSAVLRMVEAFVGPEQMRSAVSGYVRKYAYSNAAGEDFWNEVTRATGKPVDRIMKSFVDQAGAPVLAVTTSCRQGTSEITVSQSRFAGSPDSSQGPQPSQTWVMPVCFKTGGVPRCEVIARATQSSKANGCDPVLANAGSDGYYLTEYTTAMVRALADSVAGLTPAERLGLLGDEWWMVRSARHDLDAFLDLAAALSSDTTAEITSTLVSRLNFVAEYIADAADRTRFEAWIRARFGPSLTALGVPGDARDEDERERRRSSLLRLVGVTGDDEDVRRTARSLAIGYIANSSSLSPTLAATVLNVAAVAGDQDLYDRYVAQLDRLTGNPEQYYRFFNALAWFSDPALVRRTLDFTLTPAARSQDVGLLLGALLGRPAAREMTWAFVKAQWPKLVDKLGTFQGIPEVVSGLGNFCSLEASTDVRQFFTRNQIASVARTVQQSVERIEACAAMDRRQSGALATWLAKQ
jgi:aminopeptidase N